MSYTFGVATHPVTKENALVVQAQPQPWLGPDVLNLLRTIKKHFPKEFRAVQYEMILPDKPKLEIPEDIGGKTE